MSEIHPLRLTPASSSATLEAVSPQFQKKKLLWARDQSWKLFEAIKAELKEGISEPEAFKLAMQVSADRGVTKHWHKPYIRFGRTTVLTFHDDLDPSSLLEVDSPVYIDLGPAWLDSESEVFYEGDVGDTFVFGKNIEAEKCASTAREIFKSIEQRWKTESLSGHQLYGAMKKSVEAAGYVFNEKVQGHRIGDFPHHKYSKEKFGNLDFKPAPLLWVLEIHLKHPTLKMGAFFEDILGASH